MRCIHRGREADVIEKRSLVRYADSEREGQVVIQGLVFRRNVRRTASGCTVRIIVRISRKRRRPAIEPSLCPFR